MYYYLLYEHTVLRKRIIRLIVDGLQISKSKLLKLFNLTEC